MIDLFEYIVYRLFEPDQAEGSFSIFDPLGQFDEDVDDHTGIARSLTAAFLIILAGKRHRDSGRAESFIRRMAKLPQWADLAGCYLAGKNLVQKEIATACAQNPDFSNRLENLYEWLSSEKDFNADQANERRWSVFFPEGTGICDNRQDRIKQLRKKRMVNITELNASPLTDPGRQILFTSNVLLTVPDKSKSPEELNLTNDLKSKIFQAAHEPQIYWYDHPVQIGVKPEQNEVFYGLRGLDETVEYERNRDRMPADKITCLLSVSVTHQGLQCLAKRYLEEDISQSHGFKNIDVYVCTEADAKLIAQDILVPAAEYYTGNGNAAELLSVFGVDGEYGRHYSFLKAISAFWNVLIDPEIKATFKIDLDQVFPQEELVEQSKASAFEHFKTPLWGARGVDSEGQPIELGMIAGALVNETDIGTSLFTPDVLFPPATLSPEEKVFFSTLPQALSTEAEMMTRYNSDDLDGVNTCIQRIHVTGGTNGILIDSLRRHRPFTPSFIGRAEDQAYILSILPRQGVQLAYVHKDGLIMRHDKEAFALDAIKAASSGKLVGDYVRTLFFSEYARSLISDISRLKRAVDPFTGCFMSIIPNTVVFLRFCLKAASFYASGKDEQGFEFVTMGMPRIQNSLEFIDEENSLLSQSFKKERLGWDIYYDVLEALEKGLKEKDGFAIKLQNKARVIMQQCLITEGTED
ncbi:MAG: hypothetical protein JRI74_00105 [Deltaproteobacteria bacterium]|nr:hypothetical protein [Deltaproteobacteria bacterium]